MVPPAVCTYSPDAKSGKGSQTEDMQMRKAANRHLQIPVSSQCLSAAAGGIISADYCTVSDVVIKPNQEMQTTETYGEQNEEEKPNATERWRGKWERGVCLCEEEEEKKRF